MSNFSKDKVVSGPNRPDYPILNFEQKQETLIFNFDGKWTLDVLGGLTVAQEKWQECFSDPRDIENVIIRVSNETIWDSLLVNFLIGRQEFLSERGIPLVDEYPQKLQQMISFGLGRRNTVIEEDRTPLENGSSFAQFFGGFANTLNFIGAWIISLSKVPLGNTYMRMNDFVSACRRCGASALPIITLISFLTGLTMAFVGSVQLEKFNAKIYIADLVCLAMVREMGALMVGIVMAGRTGASFAAELGNMKLNEELDSLRTFGIAPMEFLVLPRTLALLIMTPMLTIYADIVGMLGGLTVGVHVMDFSMSHYIEQTQSAIFSMWEVFSGLLKSLAFGLIIGLVGCFKGLHTENTSSALGQSVTSAVVLSITFIVITDAFFEILFSALELR